MLRVRCRSFRNRRSRQPVSPRLRPGRQHAGLIRLLHRAWKLRYDGAWLVLRRVPPTSDLPQRLLGDLQGGRHVLRSELAAAFVPPLALVLIRANVKTAIVRMPGVRGNLDRERRPWNGRYHALSLAPGCGRTEGLRKRAGETCPAAVPIRKASRQDLARARRMKLQKAHRRAQCRVGRPVDFGLPLVRDHRV